MDNSKAYGSRALGFSLTLMGALLWAVGGSCGQRIFEVFDVSANWLIPIRLLVTSAILLLFSFLRHDAASVMQVWTDRRDTKDLILFSLFGAGASQYTYYTCIQYSNAAFATVISYMFPVVILLYGMKHTKRLPKRYETVSVLLVTVGAFICTTHFELGALSVSPMAILFGLLAAVTAAYNTVKPQRLLKTYPLLAIIGWSMGISGIVLTLLCRPWRFPVAVNAELVLLMAVIIVGGTLCAFCFFQAGVRIVGSLAGSILASIEPVGAVLIAVFFLNVAFTVEDFIGFILILSTIPLIALGQSRDGRLSESKAEQLASQADTVQIQK